MRDEALPWGGRRAPTPPPPLHDELVRARLLEQVGRRFSVPLLTVVGGAGFGKSTLLGQAIRANSVDPRGIDAWVSCEPGDGDADHLANAILVALGRHSDRRDPLPRLLDALGQLAPFDVCLVVDDVHEVPERSSGSNLLAELVRARPPHVHLVLAGRRQPPVPLARLRAAGQVVDVSVDDLAFSDDEAAALADLLGADSNRLAGIDRMGGWPSLIRLAFSAPVDAAPQFLLEEIVAGLPASDRLALLALGTLGWGTPADVEVVADEGPLDLARLAAAVPLIQRDDHGHYRAHHLWEDAVERIFPDAELGDPRRRALELFEQRGETLRGGWRALRWGDVAAVRAAACHLVRDTIGALPIDSAERWLVAAPEAARATPELRLLALAVRQARRYDDAQLGEDIDAVVEQFMASNDHQGAAVALGLGAVVAHTCGDEMRLLAIDGVARSLVAADDQPMLRFLAGMMTAAVASLRGDADGAVAAITALSFDEVPTVMTEFETRHLVNMLGMAGRADEAVIAAAPLLDSASPYVRTVPDHARWLAGDPSAFVGGRLTVDPGAGTNERYLLYHATYGTAVAASFGDGATVEALRPTIEKFSTGNIDARDEAMIAFATAVRQIVEHDEDAARRTIARYADEHDERDGLADLHMRRLLAVAYVSDERIRGRWSALELGPTQARQRAVADDFLAARAGQLGRGQHLAEAGVVLTALPLPWSVELACRAVAAGAPGGQRLAIGLADLAPAAVRGELERAAAADGPLREGATALLDALPDPERPTVTIGVLGPLRITDGDEPVEVAELRRRRVRSLLELLVLAGPVRRDRLADLLWPDLDALAAGRNLRVTMSRLRSVLEPGRVTGGKCPALRIDGETVALAPPPCVDVDLWQFRRHVEAADLAAHHDDPAGVVAALEQAAALWRGEPFPDVDLDGELSAAIGEVRRTVADTVLRLGELLLVSGRFGDAASWAERVKRASPLDERAHRLAIAAQLQRRDQPAVGAAVGEARAMLETLGVEPEPGTRMLLRQAEDQLERYGSAA
ncbi:MAG TPA: BTAD domain-containing putative transcriptional regulator [Desertimonas sp.]|nr:BTAD domain-containing putative transcriptional regulator [Desertimonas sp.]